MRVSTADLLDNGFRVGDVSWRWGGGASRPGTNKTDPTRLNLDPMHFITEDLPGSDMPFPFDPMIEVDPRCKVLAKQKSTGWPSLAVCAFGDGRVVVQTANENLAADIKLGDEILRRMVIWAAGRESAKIKKQR